MSANTIPYVVDTRNSPYTRLKPLALSNVKLLNQGFWSDWQTKILRNALLHGYQENLKNHVIGNFEIASGRKSGSFKGKWFADSELYKWIEAAAFYLVIVDDKEVMDQVEYLVKLIRESQLEDGYLNTFFQLAPGVEKWSDMIYGHEQYCAGHLFQAAVAHYRATGNRTLLDVALKFADHIVEVFGPGKREEPCGHPEIKMGLVELYRITGETRYLKLAQFLLDQRGKGLLGGEDHHQDHVGIRDAVRVAGHAVRQLYLLSGATDIWLETGEPALIDALKRLWTDMVEKRIHITGGVGATPKIRIAKSGDEPYFRGEAFGEDFDLPNFNVHNETCAQVANVMWNWRMLLGTGSVAYADLMEWTLYNGALSGIGLDGTQFFYTNPLASKGDVERKPWFPVACCPPNIMRTIASVQNYCSTIDEKGIQIHLYDRLSIRVENTNTKIDGTVIDMETEYPWDGIISTTFRQVSNVEFTISMRIPGWVTNYSVNLNGEAYNESVEPGNYLNLTRVWQAGDIIVLNLNMTPKFIVANPYIEADRNSYAITRGPIVYCIEGIDQGDFIKVADLQVLSDADLVAEWDGDLLGGIVKIRTKGLWVDNSAWGDKLYRFADSNTLNVTEAEIVAIPYYAWANREPSSMCVWCGVSHG